MAGQKKIDLEPYQARFFESKVRFPGFVAAWATGKTMTCLLKGIVLSQIYKNNLGLIVRRKFTDLRDSTMKDFERYTGLKVPQATKEVALPNGSVIMFRHGEELSGLQNINLGWYYIEQAEEFPTETQFDLLRGRLRRELEVDPEFIVDPESPYCDFLSYLQSSPTRQGMVVANAHGHNWVWKRWIKSPTEDYEGIEACSFDNKANLPEDYVKDIAKLEVENPSKYAQYVKNCHDEIDLAASYYATIINELKQTKHIRRVPFDHDNLVYTVWDLGFDATVIWFFQVCGAEVNFIDYYDNTGKPIAHYIEELQKRKTENHYNYGTFYLPHDGNKREMQTGQTLADAVKKFGYDIKIMEREPDVNVGINRTTSFLKRCYFDETKCEVGIEALIHYQRGYDEERRCYTYDPLHDWSSHASDAMRICSKVFEKGAPAGMNKMDKDRWRTLKADYGY